MRKVKYVRGDERRTEPWCPQCRREKLVRRDPDPSSTATTSTDFPGRLAEMDRPGV
ncbi:MAG TPA: hypothetical protein VG455_13570 [Acidimicrobiales bacterium]|nr:hypothetical protein [Acidimicrobiales bacterium]